MNVAVPPQYAISICAGVGGFDLALRIAFPQFKSALYIEREITAAEILVARMEEGSLHPAPVYSDLVTFDGKPWRGLIHTILAGLPCQPYSVAGKQLGHDDPRAIWPAFIRVLGEVQPEVVWLENVPQFIRYFRPVGNALQGLGYTVEEPLFVTAAEVGASHKRERFFALAHKPGARLSRRTGSEQLPDRSSLQTPRPGYEHGDLADAPVGRRGILREPSGSDGLTDGSDTAMADPPRHERPGPHREAGTRRRVCEAGDELADTPEQRRQSIGACEPGAPDTGQREPDGCPEDMADPRHGLFPVARRGSEGRDGTGPAEPLLGDSNHQRRRSGDDRTEEKTKLRWRQSDSGRDDLGHTDQPGLQGRQQCGHGTDEWATGTAGDSELADAERAERRPDLEHNKLQSGWLEAAGRLRRSGDDLADTDSARRTREDSATSAGRQAADDGCATMADSDSESSGRESDPSQRAGWQERGTAPRRDGESLPVFAPGPGATAVWQALLVQYPWLRPAISQAEAEQLICALADGPASTLAGSRTDQLRACGNAVVALQAALALRTLAERAGLI